MKPKKKPRPKRPPEDEKRCVAIKSNGERCAGVRVNGTDHCHFHGDNGRVTYRKGYEKRKQNKLERDLVIELGQKFGIGTDPEKHRHWLAGLAVKFFEEKRYREQLQVESLIASYHRQAGEQVGDVMYQAEYFRIDPEPETKSDADTN